MCTKSPTSAEHCALLTEGPARHGSCFANFHSFKLNSSCSYFSSAFWTGKEGHTVAQANSTSCSAEDVCKGIWWSTAVGKTQLKWPTVRKHDAYCLPLAWKWCRKQESTFLFASACWEKVLPAWGLHDGHVLAVCYPTVGMDKEGYKGLGGQRGWASRAALILQDAALVGPHVVQMGQSGWWLTIHQLITMSTLPEEVAMVLVSIPTGVTSWRHLFPDDFLSGLRRPVRWSPQTRALVAFQKIQLFVSLLRAEERKKKVPLYWSCYAMSHLLPDGSWASVPLGAAVISLITSICSSRRAASSSPSAVWVLSVSSAEVGSDSKQRPSGQGCDISPVPHPCWVAGPKIKTPTQWKARTG